MSDAPDVSNVSKEAAEMHAAAKLPRALMAGTEAMRTAGETYLPKEAAESADAYKARKARSFLFNAFGKTVEDMTGKVFTRPIVLKDDVPEQVKTFAENIDQAGRHLNVFARDVMFDALPAGIGFLLTDMPPALPVGSTLADEQAAGLRPYLVYIPVERVLGWKSQSVAGAETLTQFRFTETVSEPNGEFAEKEIEQIRVLEPGKWRTFRKADKPAAGAPVWVLHQEGMSTIVDKIPVTPVYLKRSGFMCGTPPLAKLAELNVAHWQSSSDQRNILHVARVPILFMAGFTEDDTVEIGASKAVRASSADAKMVFVEHTGAAIDSGAADIKELELQMQAMGLQLLIDGPGGQSATGEIRDDAKENSPLAMMAGTLGDAIEQSLAFMAEFAGLGKDAGGSVVVNTDFGISTMDVPQVTACFSAGLIDAQTAVDELKRRGFLSDDVDAEVVMERLANAMKLEAQQAMDLVASKPQPNTGF